MAVHGIRADGDACLLPPCRYKNEQLGAELNDVVEQSTREGNVQGELQVGHRSWEHVFPPAVCMILL